MGEIIKARARYLESDDSRKQTPIIQLDRPLPNTIRVSLDGGRDNPFRPGSAIYKSADPIVDFYKNGQGSRTQSPSEFNSLVDSKSGRDKDSQTTIDEQEANDQRKSCWRRYICCCFGFKCSCCCNREDKDRKVKESSKRVYSKTENQVNRNEKLTSVIANKTQSDKHIR